MPMPGYEPPDDWFDAIPLVHNLAVVQPQHQIIHIDKGDIAVVIASLGTAALVKLVAVAFDHQPATDEQIDSADRSDLHLRAHSDPQSSQAKPNECLGAGLACSVTEFDGARIPRR